MVVDVVVVVLTTTGDGSIDVELAAAVIVLIEFPELIDDIATTLLPPSLTGVGGIEEVVIVGVSVGFDVKGGLCIVVEIFTFGVFSGSFPDKDKGGGTVVVDDVVLAVLEAIDEKEKKREKGQHLFL